MTMFSDFFLSNGIQAHKLSSDSYFVRLANPKLEPNIKVILEVKYNLINNYFVEKKGFSKVLSITKNMKGTNIKNWQENSKIFDSIKYFDLKYSNFDFIDKILSAAEIK